ncbi:MAG TPA: hypothetical protein VGC13_19760 [Longimicrobium sp.]|uniref:TRADD-N-associated membrane domain-containing protein n=1 Tax=Longimicrobium sp. TaxID=2029185 RepID=UPI002ED77493
MNDAIASTATILGLIILVGLFFVALSSRKLWDRLSYLELPDFSAEALSGPALIQNGNGGDDRVRLEEMRVSAENQQISQVFQYYKHILRQAQVSFLFSIAAATLGFGIIVVVGIIIPLMDPAQGDFRYSGIISGLIIDAVALLFFSRLNQAQKAMTEFFEKLRLDRRVSDALRLCDLVANPDVRSQLQYDLCLHFAGIRGRNAGGNPSLNGATPKAKRASKGREPAEVDLAEKGM